MKPTLIVLCLLSCVTLIQGQFGWFDLVEDKFDKKLTVDRSCTTEYDDIHSEKCDTKYHLSCVKQSETVCRPTQVRLCNPEPIESCHFVKEDKCMHVPIPSCDVTWHKVCKDKLVCSKTFEVTVPHIPPPPVYKEPVPTGGSGVPVGPIINNPDVSVEVTPQEENVEVMVDDDDIINADDEIEPDDEIEGPVGPMINRRKRSLKELKLIKLGAKIGGAGISAAAISGVIPGVSVDLPFGVSVGSIGAPINNRRRRSLDEVMVDDDDIINADDEIEPDDEIEGPEGSMINRRKRSLTVLKLKKLGAKIGIAGISAAAISGASNRRRRSLDEVMVDDDDIINADDEIEGPEGSMINRRKRSLTALKLKKLGAKIGIAGISAAAISGVIPGVSVGPPIPEGPINNRQRRSLDEDDEVEETEEYEDLEEIETLPIPAGYSMPYESEEDHGERQKRGLPDFSWAKKKPVKNCVTQKKCTNVPKKDCGIHKKETCIPFPKKKCETKYIEKCYTVTRQECGEAINKKCTSIPTKDCKKVIERRPRLVCPPPPTLERIQEPVFTKEVPIEGSGVPVGPIINN